MITTEPHPALGATREYCSRVIQVLPQRAIVAVDIVAAQPLLDGLRLVAPHLRITLVDCAEAGLWFAQRDSSVEMAVIEADVSDPSVFEKLASICQRRPTPIVVLRCGSLAPEMSARLLRAGVRGLFPRIMDSNEAGAAFMLVMSGHFFASPWLLLQPEQPHANAVEEEAAISGPPALSTRESDVAKLLSCGKTNKEIAYHLGLSEVTVKIHMTSILRKLGARNRTEATLKLMRLEGEGRPPDTAS